MKLEKFLEEISPLISDKDTLAVNASPRETGNCRKMAALINKDIPGSSAMNLKDFDIKPCTGCLKCAAGPCALSDDFGKFINLIRNRQALIIISPVFFTAVPAQLKALIDRCQAYWSNNIKPVKNCDGYFVLIGEQSKDYLDCASRPVRACFNTLGITHRGSYYILNNEIS
ncbi:flavodoxin family protein [bacterium]|nr:flavodoxin family protein [Candidatus Omnitrophota bacterium]MBU2528179.1 flavodoxin family protein [bacterium]MBU3929557.1 flavodoxin family protein [bacterium]MBU4123340.1 flavodoxin family protein [bacterium]